jgi:hypothetical protein
MKEIINMHSGKLFMLLLLVVLTVLGFQNYLFLHPVGPHYFRQTDSLAFVEYYVQHNFNFFEPGVWNLGNDSGQASSEFPILYYLTALISVFTENKHVVLRSISLVISLVGFYYLFRLTNLILKNTVFSILFSLLFISSTVVLFYAVNFLPDSSALALTFCGWYFGLRDRLSDKKSSLSIAMVLFLFAGLIKAPYSIHPIACLLSILYSDFRKTKSIKEAISIHKKNIFLFTISALLIAAWYIYSNHYNSIHNSHLFIGEIFPFWNLSSELIGRVWLAISHDWYSSYYYPTTFHVLLIVLIVGIYAFFKSKVKSELTPVLIILFFGVVGYVVLFYSQFLDHDYYMLNILPFIVLLIIFLFHRIGLWKSNLIYNPFTQIALAVIVVLSLNYADRKLEERFTYVSPVFEKNRAELEGIQTYFLLKGIPRSAKMLVLGERTSNGAFYWMNRSGWNISKWDDEGKEKWKLYAHKADYILLMPSYSGFSEGGYNLFGKYKNTKIYISGND